MLANEAGWKSVDGSDLDLAFEVEDAATLQLNPISLQAADNPSAARRRLEGAKRSLAESIGPIRRQHAMSRRQFVRDPLEFLWQERNNG